MARLQAVGDAELLRRARRSALRHTNYRSRAHRAGKHALVVARLEDAHDDLCLSVRTGSSAFGPVPSKATVSTPSLTASIRADYGKRSSAAWRIDAVKDLGGSHVGTTPPETHLRDLSTWYRGEVDRSVTMSKRQKRAVRRNADALLLANLVGLHHLRLAALNPDVRFGQVAAAGLQRP